MGAKKHSEDVATEPYIARGDDANGMKCFRKKDLTANSCLQNWWRYKYPSFLALRGAFRAINCIEGSPKSEGVVYNRNDTLGSELLAHQHFLGMRHSTLENKATV